MNDEYLWQKTGEDPEIARLENTLSVLRYRETEPAAIPVPAPEAQVRGWRFRIAFAIPAFAAIVIAATVWFLVGDRNESYDVTFVHHPDLTVSEEPVQTQEPASQPLPAVQPPASQPKQPVRRTQVEVQSASLPRPKRHAIKTAPRRSGGTVALTKQERYAYEQLMIALSISSSKLNIVRNTINGVEESNDTPKQNNR